jgi:hypothetical protein
MGTSSSVVRVAALLAAAGTSLLGVPAAASGAVPAGVQAAVVTGTPIHSLPFYGSGDVTGAGTGTSGTTQSNTSVARACNGGAPIHKPQWYRLPSVSFGKVIARVDAPYHPRAIDQNATGSAFVDVLSGNVLACGTQPVDTGTGRAVAVVGYYKQSVDHCTTDEYCSAGSLRLSVDARPSGAPANDRWTNATTVPSLPFTASVNSARADDDGPAVVDFEHCERSAIDPRQRGTVWWRYTPKSTGPVPAIAVDVRSRWNRLGPIDGFDGFTPRFAVARLTPTGPVPAPHEDPQDCDSPVVLQAGQPYLIAVYVFQDRYDSSTPVTGGPLTVRIGAVQQPRVPNAAAVTVAATTGRATLRWAPPTAAAGAGPVTGYVVKLDRRSATGSWETQKTTKLAATARQWTAADLTSSLAYRLRVAAVNSAGAGVSAFEVLSPR